MKVVSLCPITALITEVIINGSQAGGAYSVDKLDKGVIHVPARWCEILSCSSEQHTIYNLGIVYFGNFSMSYAPITAGN